MHVMPSRTALAAALTLALAAPSAFAATRIAATSPTPDAIESARPNTSLLILRAGIYDPAQQSLDFSASNAAPASASSYAIVQFQQGGSVDRKTLAKRGIEFLGYVPNNAYYVKLSGLGTFVHRCAAPDWTPVIREAIAMFGPQRCLFGSNFPIEKLWTSYASTVATVASALSILTPSERDAVFYANAARIYRL